MRPCYVVEILNNLTELCVLYHSGIPAVITCILIIRIGIVKNKHTQDDGRNEYSIPRRENVIKRTDAFCNHLKHNNYTLEDALLKIRFLISINRR